ncbi:hypothetical protein E4U22_000473 [Claviceps purpurea]|nr:hypothetical protein E4U22_000473 [Claviceps purpurea]
MHGIRERPEHNGQTGTNPQGSGMNEVMVPLGGGPPSPANGEILGAAANKLPFRSGPLGLFPAQHP